MNVVALRRVMGGLLVAVAVTGGAAMCAAPADAAPAGRHLVVAADGCTAVAVYTNASGAVYAVEDCNGVIRHFRMSPRG